MFVRAVHVVAGIVSEVKLNRSGAVCALYGEAKMSVGVSVCVLPLASLLGKKFSLTRSLDIQTQPLHTCHAYHGAEKAHRVVNRRQRDFRRLRASATGGCVLLQRATSRFL